MGTINGRGSSTSGATASSRGLGPGARIPEEGGDGPLPSWVPPRPSGSGGDDVAASDPELVRSRPALAGFLTQAVLRGKGRKTGSVSLFAEDQVFKAAISDRETGLVSFVSSPTWEGLWEAVEQGLRTGRLDWRPSRRK